jgi:hypothetical protein
LFQPSTGNVPDLSTSLNPTRIVVVFSSFIKTSNNGFRERERFETIKT